MAEQPNKKPPPDVEMKDKEKQAPALVPEHVLKKRKALTELRLKRQSDDKTERKRQIKLKQQMIKRAEKYIKEYRVVQKSLISNRRQAKNHNNFFVEPEAKLAFVIRIRGYPSLKTIKDLIYKRGFAKINKQRIPLVNNTIIEQHLKKYGVVCIEDLIHEIYTVGPYFKEINNFLWPFKLNSPKGGLVQKGKHFIQNGDYGNREEMISELIHKMN